MFELFQSREYCIHFREIVSQSCSWLKPAKFNENYLKATSLSNYSREISSPHLCLKWTLLLFNLRGGWRWLNNHFLHYLCCTFYQDTLYPDTEQMLGKLRNIQIVPPLHSGSKTKQTFNFMGIFFEFPLFQFSITAAQREEQSEIFIYKWNTSWCPFSEMKNLCLNIGVWGTE